jgi:hypothetical protein
MGANIDKAPEKLSGPDGFADARGGPTAHGSMQEGKRGDS